MSGGPGLAMEYARNVMPSGRVGARALPSQRPVPGRPNQLAIPGSLLKERLRLIRPRVEKFLTLFQTGTLNTGRPSPNAGVLVISFRSTPDSGRG